MSKATELIEKYKVDEAGIPSKDDMNKLSNSVFSPYARYLSALKKVAEGTKESKVFKLTKDFDKHFKAAMDIGQEITDKYTQ